MQAPVSSPALSQRGKSPATARRLMLAIASVAAAGIVVSSISLYHHFGTSKTSFCDFGESFNCDIVNRSTYSTVLGVPVALIGILGYLLILALATVYRDKAETPVMLFIASLGGLCFALYLTYIEKFILQAWCVLCLSSLTLILSTTVLSLILLMKFLGQR
jgi:vitamin-K-epoxide reductase (warfarin-sensitive)